MNKADNLPMSAEEAAKEYVSDINCHSYNESINDTIKAFSRDAFEQGIKWYEENVLSHHINALTERKYSEEEVDFLISLLRTTTEYEVLESFRNKVEQFKK